MSASSAPLRFAGVSVDENAGRDWRIVLGTDLSLDANGAVVPACLFNDRVAPPKLIGPALLHQIGSGSLAVDANPPASARNAPVPGYVPLAHLVGLVHSGSAAADFTSRVQRADSRGKEAVSSLAIVLAVHYEARLRLVIDVAAAAADERRPVVTQCNLRANRRSIVIFDPAAAPPSRLLVLPSPSDTNLSAPAKETATALQSAFRNHAAAQLSLPQLLRHTFNATSATSHMPLLLRLPDSEEGVESGTLTLDLEFIAFPSKALFAAVRDFASRRVCIALRLTRFIIGMSSLRALPLIFASFLSPTSFFHNVGAVAVVSRRMP